MSTESLNIAQVYDSNYDTTGGVPHYMDELASYYGKNGHTPTYIVGESSVQDERVISLGKTFPFPLNGNLVDVPFPTPNRLVKRTLAEVDPDIMHIGVTYFPTTGGRFINHASAETGVVGTFHILPYRATSALGIRLASLVTPKSRSRVDHLLTASPIVQDFVKNTFKMDSTLVPCPVDVDRFKQGKLLPEYDDDKVKIMFLGRLDDRKGCVHLINAVAEMDETTRKKVRVVIGGAGKLDSALKQQVEVLGLGNTVEFAGRIEKSDTPDFLSSADIVALPATSGESFGIVVVEAMAAGGAVIAGDNPGYRSILGKRTPEMLVQPSQRAEFAKRLGKLVNSQSYREDVRAEQQVDLQEYDTSVVAPTILDIYRSVLSERRK